MKIDKKSLLQGVSLIIISIAILVFLGFYLSKDNTKENTKEIAETTTLETYGNAVGTEELINTNIQLYGFTDDDLLKMSLSESMLYDEVLNYIQYNFDEIITTASLSGTYQYDVSKNAFIIPLILNDSNSTTIFGYYNPDTKDFEFK